MHALDFTTGSSSAKQKDCKRIEHRSNAALIQVGPEIG
jgi:hypothetical protein